MKIAPSIRYQAAVCAFMFSLFIISVLPRCSNNPACSMPEEIINPNINKYMGIIYSSHGPDAAHPGWEVYRYNRNDCQCIRGGEYTLSLRKRNISNNVIFYLEGGGACWPGKELCETATETSGDTDIYSTDANNPLRDWEAIFIPYCDGSIHMGDRSADYSGDCVVDHYHWGLRSTSAAVALMKEQFPAPDKILIAGCSGGGYGTFVSYMLIRLAYPNTKLYIFNQSGPGLWNPSDRSTWETIKQTWNIWQYVPTACTACEDQVMYLYETFIRNDPYLRIGLFSSYQDFVIGQLFLGMMAPDYESLLRTTAGTVYGHYPDNFRRFFVNGTEHCVANFDKIYSGYGRSIYQWVGYLVNDDLANWTDYQE